MPAARTGGGRAAAAPPTRPAMPTVTASTAIEELAPYPYRMAPAASRPQTLPAARPTSRALQTGRPERANLPAAARPAVAPARRLAAITPGRAPAAEPRATAGSPELPRIEACAVHMVIASQSNPSASSTPLPRPAGGDATSV